MTGLVAEFLACRNFDEVDVEANRRNSLSASQRRGPVSLVIFGAIIGGATAGGGLLFAWLDRADDSGCSRFAGCTESSEGVSDSVAERFEANAEYDVYYTGVLVLSFERTSG